MVSILQSAPDISRRKLEHLKTLLEEHVDTRINLDALARRIFDNYRGGGTSPDDGRHVSQRIQDNIFEMINTNELTEPEPQEDEDDGDEIEELGVNDVGEPETPRRSGRSNMGKRRFDGDIMSWSDWKEENRARKRNRLS